MPRVAAPVKAPGKAHEIPVLNRCLISPFAFKRPRQPRRNRPGLTLCRSKGAGRVQGQRPVTERKRNILNRVEGWLESLGPVRATLAMSITAVLSAILVIAVLRLLEGQPMTGMAFLNILIAGSVVAVPLTLYSRNVIRKLVRSRAELREMSQRLAISAEEARDASRAKSAFLANMSHELRTPLNAILGFSEIMKDQHLGPVSNARYLSYAGDIHASGRHLLGIINDVLDLAKIESGKMSLDEVEEFALVPALSSAMMMLAGLGEKHGVSVQGEWKDEDQRLVADERMVRQIVINLVGNAIKFTPQGGQVLLSGAPATDGGYALCVRDTGVGMTESEIAVALTPFGQNHGKMASRREGTGLGLPLAKAMIELHGGGLTVESQPNRGTSVTLIFPADRVIRTKGQKAA
jgi:signal transduction histidine kinase